MLRKLREIILKRKLLIILNVFEVVKVGRKRIYMVVWEEIGDFDKSNCKRVVRIYKVVVNGK